MIINCVWTWPDVFSPHLLVCLRRAVSAAISTNQSPRQTDAGRAVIRRCLTSTQCGTCVRSVGLIAGFGWAPTLHNSPGVGVVQFVWACDYERKTMWAFKFSCTHVRVFRELEHLECEYLSVLIKASILCGFPVFIGVSVRWVWAAFMECCCAGQWPAPAWLWSCWISVIGC